MQLYEVSLNIYISYKIIFIFELNLKKDGSLNDIINEHKTNNEIALVFITSGPFQKYFMNFTEPTEFFDSFLSNSGTRPPKNEQKSFFRCKTKS